MSKRRLSLPASPRRMPASTPEGNFFALDASDAIRDVDPGDSAREDAFMLTLWFAPPPPPLLLL